jgi:hypothetical protein
VVHRTAADHHIVDPCIDVQSVDVQSVDVQSVDAWSVHPTIVERGAVDSTVTTGRRFR